MMNKIADINVTITPPTGRTIGAGGASSGATLASFLSTAIGAMTIIAAIWFLFKIIMGGIAIINSDGDKTAVANARGQITNGIIGIIVIISATFIVGLLSFIFGVNNLLDVSGFLNTI